MSTDELRKVHWLEPDDSPDKFPDPSMALREPNGLLAIGGDLSTDRLLYAYERGIFPWYQDDQPVLWWSPDPRAVLFPPEYHVSRTLRRTARRNNYAVSIDQSFNEVIRSCAEMRTDTGTWITPDMDAAFVELHRLGHAHSIEIWRDEALVGGVYGINIGRVFFGESMFSREADTSKLALLKLARLCEQFGIGLIDCQVASRHLASLGSREIDRDQFQKLLRRLTPFPSPTGWRLPLSALAPELFEG